MDYLFGIAPSHKDHPDKAPVHIGTRILKSTHRGDYVESLCGCEMFSKDLIEGELLPTGRGRYCGNCCRSLAKHLFDAVILARGEGSSPSQRIMAMVHRSRDESWDSARFEMELLKLRAALAAEEEELLTPTRILTSEEVQRALDRAQRRGYAMGEPHLRLLEQVPA